jgi:hypothetical protein
MEPAADSAAMYIGYNGLTRFPFDGSAATQLDSNGAFYVVTDDVTVYYIVAPCIGADDEEGCSTEASIHSVPKAGGAATTLVAEAPEASQLALGGGFLYWIQGVNSKSTIRRMPIAGGQPEIIVTGDAIHLYAVDDTRVVWEHDSTGGSLDAYDVMMAPLSDLTTATLLLHQTNDRVFAMTSDDTAVVWSSAWGKLWLVAK